ncbi:hypothetical protein LCGC14_2952170 [marine sediment metagenome]|uniref:Uncharacterized protein n=1 Tax=marine sediment metagenome TaxID=412755 RepID=A0A0F8ZMJ8_9ZZZZ
MVDFYKGDKNIDFKLKDLEVVENFQIWIGFGQQLSDQEMITQYGVVLQFPVREGALQGTDGVLRDVQTQIKFMKQVDFLIAYPKMGKRTQWIRNILIAGVEYRYGFSKTSHTKLNAMLVMTPGKVPDVTFKQTFNKNNPPASMYDIILATTGEAGTTVPIPNPVPVTPITPAAKPTPVQSNVLSPAEKNILTSIKGLPKKVEKDKFIDISVNNLGKAEFGSIPADKAKDRAFTIYETMYK